MALVNGFLLALGVVRAADIVVQLADAPSLAVVLGRPRLAIATDERWRVDHALGNGAAVRAGDRSIALVDGYDLVEPVWVLEERGAIPNNEVYQPRLFRKYDWASKILLLSRMLAKTNWFEELLLCRIVTIYLNPAVVATMDMFIIVLMKLKSILTMKSIQHMAVMTRVVHTRWCDRMMMQ